MMTDSKSIISLLKKQRHNVPTVNDHKGPDVDLEIQIIYEIKELEKMGYYIVIRYVKAHQNKSKKKHKLDHFAKMNILADDLCKEARALPSQKQYYTFPQNKVDFSLNSNYINSKFAKTTTKAYHSMELCSYLQSKHHWSNATINKVWWNVYYKSSTKLSSNDRIRIIKFIHDKLPTNKRDHMKYKHHSEECAVCSEKESEDHILHCKSETRKQIRSVWIAEMKHYLSSPHTHTDVKNAIMNELENWLNPGSKTITFRPISREIQQALETQQNIGWRNFVRGRISMEWGEIINTHIQIENITDETAEKWGTKLININWKYILQMWNLRNEDTIGKTLEEKTLKKKRKVLNELQHIIDTNPDMPSHNLDLLRIDEIEYERMQMNQVDNLLYGAKILERINIKQRKQHIKNNQKINEGEDKSELDPGE
jgi:hypothetical protein